MCGCSASQAYWDSNVTPTVWPVEPMGGLSVALLTQLFVVASSSTMCLSSRAPLTLLLSAGVLMTGLCWMVVLLFETRMETALLPSPAPTGHVLEVAAVMISESLLGSFFPFS